MASTPMQDIQDVILSTAEKGQQLTLEAIRTWVDTVQAFTPELPSVPVPFAEYLPKPEDVVASYYDFAAQVLGNQRKFAEDLLKTAGPLVPGYGQPAPKAPAAHKASVA